MGCSRVCVCAWVMIAALGLFGVYRHDGASLKSQSCLGRDNGLAGRCELRRAADAAGLDMPYRFFGIFLMYSAINDPLLF